jgi:hypothetical protein
MPESEAYMLSLHAYFGHERTLHENTQALHFAVNGLSPGVVGAMQITCADETEVECVRAFRRGFAQFVLPSLKSGVQAPFTLANLGGRYEWGAAGVAEGHFATGPSATRGKLLVVKVNAHVGCEPLPSTATSAVRDLKFALGRRNRYQNDTTCCGLLAALLSGATGPVVDQVRELFASEGKDRLGTILDEAVIVPELRPLVAAVVSARLQARVALLDIQDHAAATPTSYLVVACVTLNRPGPDTEILCGAYYLDGTDDRDEVTYQGLGDDPAAYDIAVERGRFVVRDEHIEAPRAARDHRAMVREEWKRRHAATVGQTLADDRLESLRLSVLSGEHRNAATAKRLLGMSLPVLAEIAPVPAAILMFAEGALGIHHVFRVHRLAQEMEGHSVRG